MCYGQKMKYCIMDYTNEDIEFAIRLLNRREEVPEEEAQAWLAEPGHEELVDELALIRKVLSAQKGHEAQPAEMPRLQRRVNGRKLRRRIAGWCAAAAAVAVLAIVGGDLFRAGSVPAAKEEAPRKLVELTLASGEQLFIDPQGGGTAGEGIPYDTARGLDYTAVAVAGADSTAEERLNTLRTPAGGAYQLTLADGTRVWVNEQTVIRYPERFQGKERKVELWGEAYFDVAHDGTHPFLVEAYGVEVKVYGTEFNVNAYSETNIQTVLVEGKVGVRVRETGEEAVLKPRQLAEYDGEGSGIAVSDVSPYAYIAWKDGEFVFDNTRVEDIMERLASWYGLHVFYATEGAKEVRFSGILDRNDSFEEGLERMESTGTVLFGVKGESVTVYAP